MTTHGQHNYAIHIKIEITVRQCHKAKMRAINDRIFFKKLDPFSIKSNFGHTMATTEANMTFNGYYMTVIVLYQVRNTLKDNNINQEKC